MSNLTPLQPHGSLEEFAPDVFRLRGSVAMGPGIRIARNMVVLRHDGELTVLSGVRACCGHAEELLVRPGGPEEEREAVGEVHVVQLEALARLDALGTVRNVVKIGMHGMDDAWFLQEWPDADLWTLPGVDHRPGGRSADRELSAESLPVPWLRFFQFQDTKAPECALLADRDGGVLLTCDSVQHWPDLDGCSLLGKGVSKLMGLQKRMPVIGPPWKMRMTPQGGSLKADFERLAALDFAHLIGGHGAPMRDAKEALVATVEATFG